VLVYTCVVRRHVPPKTGPVSKRAINITPVSRAESIYLVAKKNAPSNKPVRQAQLPSKFSPDYVAFVTIPLTPEQLAAVGEVNPLNVLTRLEETASAGYRITVEKRPDGFYQASLYGLDTGTAEDDGIGVSAGGQSPVLALTAVLLKLALSGVLSIHLKQPDKDRPPMW